MKDFGGLELFMVDHRVRNSSGKRSFLRNSAKKIRKVPGLIQHQFRASRTVKITFFVSLGLNVLLWAGLAYLFRPQVEPVHLHYNIFFGVDLIGPWWRIFLLPLSGLIIVLLNTALSAASFKEDKALSYTVLGSTVAFQLLLFIGAYLIALVN